MPEDLISPKEVTKVDKIFHAVADAVMVIQAGFLRKSFDYENNLLAFGDLKRYQQYQSADIDRRVELASTEKCVVASANAILFLHQKYPDLFNFSVILKSSNTGTGLKWYQHAYFLAESKDGRYFAASPANEDEDKGQNYLTTIFCSEDLQEVLKKIQDKEGGKWPSQESILSAYKRLYFPPKNVGYGVRVLEVAEVGNKGTKIYPNYVSMEYLKEPKRVDK